MDTTTTPEVQAAEQAHAEAATRLAAARETRRCLMSTQTRLIRERRESSDSDATLRARIIDIVIAGEAPDVDSYMRVVATRQLTEEALVEIGRRIHDGLADLLDCEAAERATFGDLERARADREERIALDALGEIRSSLGEGGAIEFRDVQFQRRRDVAADADLEAARLRDRAEQTRQQDKQL